MQLIERARINVLYGKEGKHRWGKCNKIISLEEHTVSSWFFRGYILYCWLFRQ